MQGGFNGAELVNVILWKSMYEAMLKCESVTVEHVHRHDFSYPGNRDPQRLKLRRLIKMELEHQSAMRAMSFRDGLREFTSDLFAKADFCRTFSITSALKFELKL